MRRGHRVILGGGMQILGAVIGIGFVIAFATVTSVAIDGKLKGAQLYFSFGAVAMLLALSITLMLGGARFYRKALMNLCPRCEYDLRGRSVEGCPECGWNRYDDAAPDM